LMPAMLVPSVLNAVSYFVWCRLRK
jgi:hypothetical protein